jgi:Predicted acetyltransferase involved in intracellular survival and related acetyltransferases
METRLVNAEELPMLKEIWKLTFGDEDSFIEFFFQNRDWVGETAVLEADGRVVSMLTMIPVSLIGTDGTKHRASMLYAIATHPGFQKQGLAERLIEFSNRYLASKKVFATVLVPAGEELFRFYEKRGYKSGFMTREAIWRRGEVKAPAASAARVGTMGPIAEAAKPLFSCRIAPAQPGEYNRIRRECLNGRAYLDYRNQDIVFEKRLARLYGTDIFSVEINGAKGCICAERISEKEVILKEFLLPDRYMLPAMEQLSERLSADQFKVRTPSHSGIILGGAVRPFGMIRINGKDGSPADITAAGSGSHLGIAYD